MARFVKAVPPLAAGYLYVRLHMNARAALLLLIVAFASVFAGCSGQTELQSAAASVERQLAWVEAAKPEAMLDADARAGRQRFLSVCGYSCVVPGIGELTATRCYPSVRVQTIEGTSDTILSERHAALVRRAAEVAAEYNTLAARALTTSRARAMPSRSKLGCSLPRTSHAGPSDTFHLG
jgi:hypothetical protein